MLNGIQRLKYGRAFIEETYFSPQRYNSRQQTNQNVSINTSLVSLVNDNTRKLC